VIVAGVMDGVDLAHELKMRWPHLNIILTSGNVGERLAHLPPGVEYMATSQCPHGRGTGKIVIELAGHYSPFGMIQTRETDRRCCACR
jgi:hypothetical protein